MRIAVVGGGVAGLVTAWLLRTRHEVSLYEQADYIGGHAHTATMTIGEREIPVDTAFITFSADVYPIFSRLLDHLGVASRPAPTSFSCHIDGRDVGWVYGPRRTRFRGASSDDWLKPSFRRMLLDTLRFYRNARELLGDVPRHEAGLTIGAYLERGGYSDDFVSNLLLPGASALWSLPLQACRDLDAAALVAAFNEGGYLSVWNRRQWRTVAGGSQQYVRRLVASLEGRIRLRTEVGRVTRQGTGVLVRDSTGAEDRFDHVVMAAHADQTLRMLADPSEAERQILGRFTYFPNTVHLHHDPSLMPRSRSHWATWNYAGSHHDDPSRPVAHTYWMNRLQGLDDDVPTFVSLNPMRLPHADLVERVIRYEHPTLDPATVAAQKECLRIQGVNRTSFCGACYERWGSHEDAIRSGLSVARSFGADLPWV